MGVSVADGYRPDISGAILTAEQYVLSCVCGQLLAPAEWQLVLEIKQDALASPSHWLLHPIRSIFFPLLLSPGNEYKWRR